MGLQLVEIIYFRTVKGCTRRDHIKNEDMRKELKVQSVQNKIDEHRRSWKNHMRGMTDEIYANTFCITNQRDAEVETETDFGKDGMSMRNRKKLECLYDEARKE
jgi:hypothetical protein